VVHAACLCLVQCFAIFALPCEPGVIHPSIHPVAWLLQRHTHHALGTSHTSHLLYQLLGGPQNHHTRPLGCGDKPRLLLFLQRLHLCSARPCTHVMSRAPNE
jgi:hypothetical protein